MTPVKFGPEFLLLKKDRTPLLTFFLVKLWQVDNKELVFLLELLLAGTEQSNCRVPVECADTAIRV